MIRIRSRFVHANSPRCCHRPPSRSPRAGISCRNCGINFRPGTDVTITFLPGDNYRHNVETASALRRAGYNPVPHIAAREMPSREVLDDFLARLRARPMSARILLIAGDVAAAKGPFRSSLDVCASGLIEAHGIALSASPVIPKAIPISRRRAPSRCSKPGATGGDRPKSASMS